MRILVIDDDSKLSKYLKSNLETEFFVVDVATDGERGSYLGRCNDYDLIILDNALPKKTGMDVCREIREKRKDVKIIILSTLLDVTTKVDFLEIGADDYMVKPFSFRELLARIKALLRRNETLVNTVIQVGNLSIDTNSHKVRCGKRNICLTRKEFMLLEYLSKNAGRVISQGNIMEHIWDRELDTFSNTLKSHISNLRSKIDNGRKPSFIQTVNGIGYMVEIDS